MNTTAQATGIVTAHNTIALVVLVEEKVHTDARPFCSDIAYCPCHTVIDASTGKITDYYLEYIEGPRLAGLLSYDEAMWIYHNEHM